jgi:hypothetical protein
VDAVPPDEVALTASTSSRFTYIAMHQANDVSPFVTARDGRASADHS